MRKVGLIETRQGANLPHWTRDGATYAVTFRLADSLPQQAIDRLLLEYRRIERKSEQHAAALSLEELVRRSKGRTEAYHALLDEGYGECTLANPEIAKVVADALKHFDGNRYQLFAWCVMPNHVHSVVIPFQSHDLPEILHSWKSFTAKAANKALGRTGSFWQRESYDHLIRDEADFAHHVHYVRENPRVAGLVNWPWVG